MTKIAPSILSADFSKLEQELKRVISAGADLIHIDVMDGHFVPNITIGPPVVKALRQAVDVPSGIPFDVHLMIEKPEDYIDAFVDSGADIISVHVEATRHLHRTIQRIKQRGVKAGAALNPATPLDTIEWVLEDVDMVLLMSVNPGFGGQAYIESTTRKTAELKSMINALNLEAEIEIDGGITTENCRRLIDAGANVIVSGTTVFEAADPHHIIKRLRGS